MDINRVKALCHVCCPFDMLIESYLPRIIEEKINLEVGLNGGVLDRYSLQDFKKVARILKDHHICCTVHAPFIDLSLGAIDKLVRQVTVERLKTALDIASLFEAKTLVCHTGFDPKHYYNSEERWQENALESLSTLLMHTKNTPIVLENVFEHSPKTLRSLLEGFDSELLGFCLDMGHLSAFSNGNPKIWFRELQPWLMQLHLHDNTGDHDDHLPVGHGTLDFPSLFALLHSHKMSPLITLEPHKEEDVIPSLQGLGELLDRYPLKQSA